MPENLRQQLSLSPDGHMVYAPGQQAAPALTPGGMGAFHDPRTGGVPGLGPMVVQPFGDGRQEMAGPPQSRLERLRSQVQTAEVSLAERSLNKMQLTPEGENIRRTLMNDLQTIRNQRDLRPQAYQEAMHQWMDDLERSGIRNHVQPPPDPYEMFGGFRQNPETGELEFNQGQQVQYLPTGQIAMPDGKGGITTRDIPSAILERVSPRALAKMLSLPETDILPTSNGRASARPVAPFTTAEGFDDAAYQKAADSIRKELTTEKYDSNDNPVTVVPSEAAVQKQTVKRWYAAQSMQGGPRLLLQGVVRGDLTPGDVQEMGFGDRLTDAVKQAVMSGQLDPVQARTLGFDVSVSDHGVGVRIRPEDQPPAASAAGLSGGPRIVPQQSMTAGQRIQQNRVAAQPFVAEIREKLESGSLSDAAARAMNVMPQQAAPVIAELKQLTELYASRLESTGVGLEFTDPEKYQRMKELNMLLEKMASPESQLRPDRVPDVFLGGGP